MKFRQRSKSFSQKSQNSDNKSTRWIAVAGVILGLIGTILSIITVAITVSNYFASQPKLHIHAAIPSLYYTQKGTWDSFFGPLYCFQEFTLTNSGDRPIIVSSIYIDIKSEKKGDKKSPILQGIVHKVLPQETCKTEQTSDGLILSSSADFSFPFVLSRYEVKKLYIVSILDDSNSVSRNESAEWLLSYESLKLKKYFEKYFPTTAIVHLKVNMIGSKPISNETRIKGIRNCVLPADPIEDSKFKIWLPQF